MLPIKQIYIDSKHKTKDSVSTSHFKYDLPESFLMPDNCGFYVCDVTIPHSWYTIEHGINDRFYLHVSNDNANINLRPNQNYAIILDSKQYTGAELATELTAKMTNNLSGTAYAAGLSASYSASNQKICISTSFTDMTFKI